MVIPEAEEKELEESTYPDMVIENVQHPSELQMAQQVDKNKIDSAVSVGMTESRAFSVQKQEAIDPQQVDLKQLDFDDFMSVLQEDIPTFIRTNMSRKYTMLRKNTLDVLKSIKIDFEENQTENSEEPGYVVQGEDDDKRRPTAFFTDKAYGKV